MLAEMLQYIALQQDPNELPNLGKPWHELRQAVNSIGDNLRHATYMMGRHDYSINRIANLKLLRASDAGYLSGLAKRVGITMSHLATQSPPEIRADVDGALEDLVVHLDDRAVEDILLAAMESYAVSAGRGKPYTEVYGICFGNRRDKPMHGRHPGIRRILRISRIVTQLRARATATMVMRNDKSSRVHRHIAEQFFEDLELLGDYHTHPYKNARVLRERHGWLPSPSDRADILKWSRAVREDGARPRFSLVVAIAEGERTGVPIKRIAPNRIEFSIQKHFIQIAAYRIRFDGECDDDVELSCPHAGEHNIRGS